MQAQLLPAPGVEVKRTEPHKASNEPYLFDLNQDAKTGELFGCDDDLSYSLVDLPWLSDEGLADHTAALPDWLAGYSAGSLLAKQADLAGYDNLESKSIDAAVRMLARLMSFMPSHPSQFRYYFRQGLGSSWHDAWDRAVDVSRGSDHA